MTTSVIKQYYDALGEGRILAGKCAACGKLTFPPTCACEHCGKDAIEWVELSGRGRCLYLTHGIAPPPNPRFAELAPYCYGHILLEEGVYTQNIVTNVEVDAGVLARIFEEGPFDVEANIIEAGDLPILAFKKL